MRSNNNLFEECFMQQKYHEINPSKRGFVARSKSKLINNEDHNSYLCCEWETDEEADKISFNSDWEIAVVSDKNNTIVNKEPYMSVYNMSPPTTSQFIAETLPVLVLMIAKFNNPTSHNLVPNPNKIKIAIDKKNHHAVSKSSNMRHTPNLEFFNNEQLAIEKIYSPD